VKYKQRCSCHIRGYDNCYEGDKSLLRCYATSVFNSFNSRQENTVLIAKTARPCTIRQRFWRHWFQVVILLSVKNISAGVLGCGQVSLLSVLFNGALSCWHYVASITADAVNTTALYSVLSSQRYMPIPVHPSPILRHIIFAVYTASLRDTLANGSLNK
jgi:hypothetical protein